MINGMRLHRGKRTSYLDRAWLNYWNVVGIVPITAPDVTALRLKMADFMASDPGHPLCCTLEEEGRRWRPVDPEDRHCHIEQVIVRGGQFDRDDPFGYLNAHRPSPDSTAPFKVIVGPDSMCIYFAHVAGDAAVFSPFLARTTFGDVEALKPLQSHAGIAYAAKIFWKELRPHWRDWWHHMRSGNAAPPPPAVEAPRLPSGFEPKTVTVGTLVSAEDFGAFKAWRKAHCADVSLAALMASAAYRALAGQQIPINSEGFYTLVDVRRYLPKRDALLPGNLAKSVYVTGDLDNPAAVAASIKQVVDSARAIPALVAGALAAGQGSPAERSSGGTRGPVTMTFNSMMRLYGVDLLPWTRPEEARFFQMAYPISANGISVAACRIGDRIELSASFDPDVVDRQAVERALAQLRDMPALLGGACPEPAGLAVSESR